MSVDAFSIVPLLPEHYARVAQIFEEGIDTGTATVSTRAASWDEFDASEHPRLRFVAVDAHGDVVGWVAGGWFSSREAYAGVVEDSLYVTSAARGRGVGRALLMHLVDHAAQEGVWTIQAKIFSVNPASLHLHTSVGFRLVGVYERLGAPCRGPFAGQRLDVSLLQFVVPGV